jgi:hypothetical protein
MNQHPNFLFDEKSIDSIQRDKSRNRECHKKEYLTIYEEKMVKISPSP